jgi:F-type H+-transporting ATPase subunit b
MAQGMMKSAREILRAGGLAALICGAVVAVPARAQEKSVPAQSAPAQTQTEKAKPQNKPEVGQDLTHQPEGPARQLVHESREAAGEETDETAQFKQSYSVQLISKWTGLDLRHAYWLSVITNFVVIAAFLAWAARKYLPEIFRNRTSAIQKAMQEAQRASEEARRRLAEIELRLTKLDAEIGTIRDTAEKEAAAEEARIRATAEEEAKKIVAAAEQEIAAASKAARRQLTALAADLAVGLAQKQIRVDAPTDQALVRNFATQLNASEIAEKDRN